MIAKQTCFWVFIILLIGVSACGDGGQKSQPAESVAEPVGLVVDLVIEEAWTMDEVARALAEKTGVSFVLSPEIDPQERLQDPYTVMLFKQNLKEHLNELEEFGLWSFTWEDGRYVIRKP